MDAYVTLLSTESFLEAALVLNQSLKNVAQYFSYILIIQIMQNKLFQNIKGGK